MDMEGREEGEGEMHGESNRNLQYVCKIDAAAAAKSLQSCPTL